MQSALVRSDIGHVIIGESAMTVLICVILFSFEGAASAMGLFIRHWRVDVVFAPDLPAI